jgi:hypothetical protein
VLKCEVVYETYPRLNLHYCVYIQRNPRTEDSLKHQFNANGPLNWFMAHPRSSYILSDTLLKYLAEVQALNDMKFLVTEVLCPAYTLYLLSGRCECPSRHA